MTELERVDDLLRRTTMALIYQCMLPPEGEVTKDHLWHCVWLAQGIENLYRARGHWNQGAAGALVDMSTARLEAVRAILYPEGQRGDPEQARRVFDDAVKEIAPYFKDVDLPEDVTAERITTIDLSRRPGLLLQLKAQEFIAAVYELASVDEINRAVAVAWLGRQTDELAAAHPELKTVYAICKAWVARDITTATARRLMELDDDDETVEQIARNCGLEF